MMRQTQRALRKARVDPPLLLAFLLPIFAAAPLAYPGYFELRSGFLPVFALTDRLAELGTLSWAPAGGTAYSLLGGDGLLPYWLAALPSALGAGPAAAIKWVMAASLLAGSVGAFSWARRRWPDGWSALIVAAVYVLNPLTLTLLYVEGAFAGVVFLGLLPWTLWAADRALAGHTRAAQGAALPVALLVAAAIWTQAALGLALSAILLAYGLLAQPEYARAGGRRSIIIGLVSGALLGALLWLPVIMARGFGAARPLPLQLWLTLALPWLGLLAGWLAERLDKTLPVEQQSLRPAFFASLLALILLGAYRGPRPIEVAGAIPPAPLAIFGENEIALLSVEMAGTPGPGGRVFVKTEWQALRPLETDYTVFFHVVGPDGQRYGQHDTMPQDGKAPTSGWQPGRVVVDRYEAILSPDAPADSAYQFWLGWYDSATGIRLPAGADDKYVYSQ